MGSEMCIRDRFHILPLAADMDKVEATPSRLHRELPWMDDAKAALDALVDAEPVLIRISAAKRLRDRAERDARTVGEEQVSAERLARSRGALKQKEPA